MSDAEQALLLRQTRRVEDALADEAGVLRPDAVLTLTQQISSAHCDALGCGWQLPTQHGAFWVVLRHRIAVQRLPALGERITLETWPLPTTRTCYPRCVQAYDACGAPLFRVHSLWGMLDSGTRAMLLPTKSGIVVPGVVRGTELPAPASLVPLPLPAQTMRRVTDDDLDANGHMNNARYLRWLTEELPDAFRPADAPMQMLLCYIHEARAGQLLSLRHGLQPDGTVRVELTQAETGQRVLGARLGR